MLFPVPNFCVVLCIFCVVLCIFCVVLLFLCYSMYFLCCSMYFCVVLCIFCVVLRIFVLFYVFLCCYMYCLFCDVLCIVCVYRYTEQLPRGGYPIAVKYIISSLIPGFELLSFIWTHTNPLHKTLCYSYSHCTLNLCTAPQEA